MFYPAGGQQYTLGSSISSTQTTILLSSFTEPVTGTPYTMALLNTDIAYGTIAPKTSQSEFISFTGITQNANGTATLTGVTRGLAKKYPFTTSGSYKLPHSGGSIFILSDVPQLFEKYISIENDVTVTGIKTFTNPDYPRMDTATPAPTDDEQLVPKKYVDDAVISGGVPATTTVLGIVKMSVAPADPASPIAVGDNDPRVQNTVSSGHTGLTSGTSGGILGFTGSTTLASSVALTQHAIVLGGGAGATPTPLGSLGTTTTVLHGNAAGAPTFGAVNLTTDVTGILPAANGGSGSAFGVSLTANSDPANMSYDTVLVDLPYSASGGTLLLGWTSSNVSTVTSTGNDFRYSGFNSGNMEKILATAVAGFTDLKFNTGKDVYIQNRIAVDPATTGTNGNTIAYGLGNSTSANFSDETSTTEAMKFVWKNVSGTYTLYCVTANGSNQESTSTTAFTFINNNEYSIAWTGSTVVYKVNGTTVATHSTYVPSSSSTIYMRIQNNSTTAAIAMSKPKVSIEI